ncbi:hypothetical protein JW851_01090 [Candidatus Woesearchaeota archaeon]|nr:hypothetical protein [Candidatus Woesearchaeota archaeon]
MKKNMPLLVLAIIAAISIIGLTQLMSFENTGMVSKAQKQPYPGYSQVTTEVACNAIHCRVGYAYPAGVDERGHIVCQCREDPEWLQYRVTPFRNY